MADLGSIRLRKLVRVRSECWGDADAILALLEDTGMTAVFGNAFHDRTGFGVHLDELDPHAGWIRRVVVGLVPPPNHATHTMDQCRLVLKDELELEKRTHRQWLLGLDEYTPPGDVAAVAFDEVFERGALVPNLQRKQRALVLAFVCHVFCLKPPALD